MSEESNIKKLSRKNMSERIFDALKQEILSKRWKVGEKLPGEIELADKFGVSRMTLRVAIQQLNMIGIVETRDGDGTYVKEFSFSDYIKKAHGFIIKSEQLSEICEFRLGFERMFLELAMKHATEDDYARIEEKCAALEEAALAAAENAHRSTEILMDITQKDWEVHNAICAATHNAMMINAYMINRESILNYMYTLIATRSDLVGYQEYMKIMGSSHSKILDAVRARDIEGCWDSYRDHIIPDLSTRQMIEIMF